MDRLLSMRVFQRVMDEGGFAAAARALDMSPAVVTRLVADLEEHLGTRLLHRTTRKLSLSDAGESYLSRVRVILQDIDEAHELASAHTQELSGLLHVVAQPVLASHVLAPCIAGFNARYPKIVLDITAESFKEPPVEDYDITLFITPSDFNADIVARKILSTQVILVAAPAYLQRRGGPQQPADLLNHDCLRLTQRGLRPRQMQLIHPERGNAVAEQDVNTALWSNHVDTLLRAALDGAGILAASTELAAAHLTSGALVQVLRPWIVGDLTLYAGLPSRKFLPRRTQVFLDFLTDHARSQVAKAMQACVNC
jgi:DNA-binding transcriptional LysR family regulator